MVDGSRGMGIKPFLIRLLLGLVVVYGIVTFVVMAVNITFFRLQDEHFDAIEGAVLLSREREEIAQLIVLNEPIPVALLDRSPSGDIPLMCCEREFALYLSALADASEPNRDAKTLFSVSKTWAEFAKAMGQDLASSRETLNEFQAIRSLVVPTSAIALLMISLGFIVVIVNRVLVQPLSTISQFMRRLIRGEDPAAVDLGSSVKELKHIQDSFDFLAAEYRSQTSTQGNNSLELMRSSDDLRAQFETLIEMAEKPGFILDASGAVRAWNKHMVAMTGIARSRVVRDIFSAEFLEGESQELFDDAFRVARLGEFPDDLQCELVLRGRGTVPLQLQLRPQLEPALGVNRVLVLVMSDVAPSVSAKPPVDVEVPQIRDQWEELAHSLHWLEQGSVAATHDEVLRQRAALGRAIQWIGQRHFEQKLAVINLSELVEHFASTLEPKLTELEYEVRLEVSIASQSLMINGSASGALQVLTELVDNATYALENDAVKDGVIGLSLSESDVGGVVLKLRDNGRGVSEAHRHTIFEPLFTTKGHLGHLGLGLTRSRDLVRAMSGQITVNTALTAPGFEVVIEFPMALIS